MGFFSGCLSGFKSCYQTAAMCCGEIAAVGKIVGEGVIKGVGWGAEKIFTYGGALMTEAIPGELAVVMTLAGWVGGITPAVLLGSVALGAVSLSLELIKVKALKAKAQEEDSIDDDEENNTYTIECSVPAAAEQPIKKISKTFVMRQNKGQLVLENVETPAEQILLRDLSYLPSEKSLWEKFKNILKNINKTKAICYGLLVFILLGIDAGTTQNTIGSQFEALMLTAAEKYADYFWWLNAALRWRLSTVSRVFAFLKQLIEDGLPLLKDFWWKKIQAIGGKAAILQDTDFAHDSSAAEPLLGPSETKSERKKRTRRIWEKGAYAFCLGLAWTKMIALGMVEGYAAYNALSKKMPSWAALVIALPSALISVGLDYVIYTFLCKPVGDEPCNPIELLARKIDDYCVYSRGAINQRSAENEAGVRQCNERFWLWVVGIIATACVLGDGLFDSFSEYQQTLDLIETSSFEAIKKSTWFAVLQGSTYGANTALGNSAAIIDWIQRSLKKHHATLAKEDTTVKYAASLREVQSSRDTLEGRRDSSSASTSSASSSLLCPPPGLPYDNGGGLGLEHRLDPAHFSSNASEVVSVQPTVGSGGPSSRLAL